MRNFLLENDIVNLLDFYRQKLPTPYRSWFAIAASVDLSRNAIYDIINSEKDVRRDTVISLGFALGMSLDDFLTLYNYKGFIFRKGILRDEITYKFFAEMNSDYDEWLKTLNDEGEEPPFNSKRPTK